MNDKCIYIYNHKNTTTVIVTTIMMMITMFFVKRQLYSNDNKMIMIINVIKNSNNTEFPHAQELPLGASTEQ